MANVDERVCSLRGGLEIVSGDMSDWRGLSEYHYRGHVAGAVDKIFIVRYKNGGRRGISGGCSREPVGVIVYGMPMPSVRLRNVATNNRYVGLGDRRMEMKLLNSEVRCINRVVIHPQYRGIGLGRWLVGETLGCAGVKFVEAMAVMGGVNPFFEKAGMRRYEGELSAGSVRLIEAFGHVGIGRDRMTDTTAVLAAMDGLCAADREFLADEMRRFAVRYVRRGRRLEMSRRWRASDGLGGLAGRVEIVVGHVFSNPVYYLWGRD